MFDEVDRVRVGADLIETLSRLDLDEVSLG